MNQWPAIAACLRSPVKEPLLSRAILPRLLTWLLFRPEIHIGRGCTGEGQVSEESYSEEARHRRHVPEPGMNLLSLSSDVYPPRFVSFSARRTAPSEPT